MPAARQSMRRAAAPAPGRWSTKKRPSEPRSQSPSTTTSTASSDTEVASQPDTPCLEALQRDQKRLRVLTPTRVLAPTVRGDVPVDSAFVYSLHAAATAAAEAPADDDTPALSAAPTVAADLDLYAGVPTGVTAVDLSQYEVNGLSDLLRDFEADCIPLGRQSKSISMSAIELELALAGSPACDPRKSPAGVMPPFSLGQPGVTSLAGLSAASAGSANAKKASASGARGAAARAAASSTGGGDGGSGGGGAEGAPPSKNGGGSSSGGGGGGGKEGKGGGEGAGKDANRKEWAAWEDEAIRTGVLQMGSRWRVIAAALPGRSDDAVRNRWSRLLHGSSGTRGPAAPRARREERPAEMRQSWTEEEDAIITSSVEECGHRWNRIAERLPRRTEHAIRNRWHRLRMKSVEGATGGAEGLPLPHTGDHMLDGSATPPEGKASTCSSSMVHALALPMPSPSARRKPAGTEGDADEEGSCPSVAAPDDPVAEAADDDDADDELPDELLFPTGFDVEAMMAM